jgi:glutathione S-transferase
MMEEHLYWAVGYYVYMQDDIWANYKPIAFGICSPEEYEIVTSQIRENVRQALHAQGMGRHSRSEICELGNADTSALADYLGDKRYFMGDDPTSLDATAYAFLAPLIYAGYESPLNSHARSFANLRSYCERMRGRYYSP